MSRIAFASLLSALLMVVGCSFTTMETARQLDSNEIVASGSLDWPGYLIIPRANVNAMYGLGGFGDINAHMGGTPVSYNFGVGSRVYPSDQITLSLQTDFMNIFHDFGFSQADLNERFIATITPRVTTAVRDDQWFYGGVQANILNGLEYDRQDGWSGESFGMGAGPVIGVDYYFEDRGIGLQTELNVSPFGVDADGVPHFVGTSDGGFFPFQFSVGGYFRSGG